MKIVKRTDRLPKNNHYVLAFFPKKPWSDQHTKHDEHKWVVVKFVRGITMKERSELSSRDPRKNSYRAEDEHGNNKEGYFWDSFGPSSFFGQEAELWCELPGKNQPISS